ncbi:MAG: hypothetical protein ACLFWB_04850 [Armatimonadota bacterium]
MADATPPDAEQQQEPKQQNTWLWVILGIIGGCGCLIVLAVLLGLGSVFYAILEADKTATPPAAEITDGTTQDADSDADQSDLQGGEAATAGSPGEQAALLFALENYSKYPAVKVLDHYDDWKNVAVIMGESQGNWEYGVWLAWDEEAKQYTVSGEGVYDPESQSILDAVPDDAGDAPDIYTPGPEVAKEAALMDTPNWVAKIVSHSSDYQKVVVWIGPPQSEWVSEITLQWDDSIDAYTVVSESEVPVNYGG